MSTDLGRIFCDLVMKGGITSGVVYPTAIAELARTYRFRNIGGASAGAIAAAGAAAAEYRRQTRRGQADEMAGFARLDGLPRELGARVEGSRHTRLFHLFAPSTLSRPLFSVLAGMLNRPTMAARLGYGVLALLRAFPLAVLVGVLVWGLSFIPIARALAGVEFAFTLANVANAVGLFMGTVAVTAATLLAVLAFALWRSMAHFAKVMAAQNFGLCTGRQADTGAPAALTDWLHALFQDMAGKPSAAPLTFGDLRRIRFAETPERDGIVLRTMTTCVTAGRPYTLPFDDAHFYFDPIEMRRLFPEDVVTWMEAHAHVSPRPSDRRADKLAAEFTVDGVARPLLPLPDADDLPVIIGVRMSLSFPILLSAIPLYRFSVRQSDDAAVSTDERRWTGYMERLLFTDGGVCSNLPIHLFDAPLPHWPTFAINLRANLPVGAPADARIAVPNRGRASQADRYPIDETPHLAATASFLAAIVNTMQNWRDMLQRGAAGFKDRVFTVRHTPQEGGLNLDMAAEAIDLMAASGALAAQRIRETFHPPMDAAPHEDHWLYHRWVRTRLLLPLLADFLAALNAGYREDAADISISRLLEDSREWLGRAYDLSNAERAAADTFLDELACLSRTLAEKGIDFDNHSPRPGGELRVTPTF